MLEYNRLKEKMKLALKDLEVRENQLLEQERRVRNFIDKYCSFDTSVKI